MTKNRLLVVFLFCTQYCFGQIDEQNLPTFKNIYHIDNREEILNPAIHNTGKVMLVFYDPGCGHCQQLASGISQKLPELKNVFIYFICMQDTSHVKGFINMFAPSLAKAPTVSFWRDPGTEFFEKFMPSNYPATYLFEATNKKLITSFQGEFDIKKILPFTKLR